MDNCHYCNTYFVLVHNLTHTGTVLCICNPVRIFTCLMTLAVTWPEQILSIRPRPWFAMITMAHRIIETSPLFFCHCKPRLFHWSKPSETSLAHLDWVRHCPSFCVVEAFVKGRWTTSPILHVRWSLTPGVSHCKCVRGLSFFSPFSLVYIIKGPYKLVILLLKHVPLSTVSSKSEAPGTPVHLCIQY